MNNQTQFCLNDYLPSNLICDMSLLDTSDSDDNISVNNMSSFQNDSYYQSNTPPKCVKMTNNLPRPISRASTMSGISNYHNMSPFNSTQNVDPRLFYHHFNEMMRREQEMLSMQPHSILFEKKKKEEIKLSEFLKTQKGSRIYQRKLKKIKSEELDSLLKSLEPHFSELLINSYGNYFCQKLYTICDFNQRRFILENVKNI